MLRRLRNWWGYLNAVGWRYVFFRIGYEFTLRTGILAMRFPVKPPFQQWINVAEWRKSAPGFLIGDRSSFGQKPEKTEQLCAEALRILAGEVQFFYGEWKRVDNDWLRNYDTGFRYDANVHWTKIPDFSAKVGDIKYVWEPNRFLFLQTIMRYDLAFDQDHAGWVFSKIDNWIDQNPINCGPNYRCSQEISIRLFNWIYALYFYRYSSELTTERFGKIIWSVYWQARHVRTNIHFSRIAVRNNHALSETLALYTIGVVFPFFREASHWRIVGKRWFEEEIEYQVTPDGGYLQFSFNYQRVAVQLLTFAISLANLRGDQWADVVYSRAYAMLKLMKYSQDPVSGHLPNYGANDGSLFFKWTDAGFRDFRPMLASLNVQLTGEIPKPDEVELFWSLKPATIFPTLSIADGPFSFSQSGIFGFRNRNTLFWIPNVSYLKRPSQADALHIDLWHNGVNLLPDGGSYRYNTDPKLSKYFMGTESHNTVMIGNEDQMLKGPRFIWLDWTKAVESYWRMEGDVPVFRGVARIYRYRGEVMHARTVRLDLAKREMKVTDELNGSGQFRQLWHLTPDNTTRVGIYPEGAATRVDVIKYSSHTYGVKERCLQIEFIAQSSRLTTNVLFE